MRTENVKCVCLNHNARSATRGVRRLTEFRHDATYFREKKKNCEFNLEEVGSADAEVEVELKILAIFHTPPDSTRWQIAAFPARTER